ncbi:IMv membrane protein [Cetacean poxvirus 1]|nr:IMv membrane protein [Cetacean poxvirus 1]
MDKLYVTIFGTFLSSNEEDLDNFIDVVYSVLNNTETSLFSKIIINNKVIILTIILIIIPLIAFFYLKFII